MMLFFSDLTPARDSTASYSLKFADSLRADTLKRFNIKKEIQVIPNFIDLVKYKHSFTDCQREMLANEGERIVTHISNFRPVKRIQDIIKVFNNIQKEISDSKRKSF